MSSTWLTRLAASHGHRPRLYFTIQGVADVFQEDSVDVPSTLEDAERPRRKLIPSTRNAISISPPRLNMATRRMEGGTVKIMLQDDEDGSLAALFSPRRRRAAYLTADESAVSTTINVTSTTAFDGVAYVGAETITFPSSTGTTFTSATRGAYGSTAEAHHGGAEIGEGVFTHPPSWVGRRLFLKSYFKNDDGTTTASLARAEGTYEIEVPPKYMGNRRWEIQCADLTDGFYKKRIGAGLKEISLPATAHMFVDPTTNEAQIEVGEGEPITQFTQGIGQTHAIVTTSSDEFMCRSIVEADAPTGVLSLSGIERVSPPPGLSPLASLGAMGQVKTVRHIALLEGTAAYIAKRVLMSRLGDNANGGFDVLPGYDATLPGEPSFRMGAGIDVGDVDVNSFDVVGTDAGGYWTFVIDGECTLADFLFEFCLFTNSVAYVTRAGNLAVMRVSETSNLSVMTIDDSVISASADPKVEYDEASIYPRVNLVCNYDPLRKESVVEYNMNDAELARRYPNSDNVLELSSKAIVVDGLRLSRHPQALARNVQAEAAVQGMLRRIQVANGRGNAYVTLVCSLKVMKLELGSLVELTASIPNLEGASSVSVRSCRVISIAPRWDDSQADLELQFLEKAYVIAPGVRIASAVDEEITLMTGGFEMPSGPGLAFAEGGMPVVLVDVSAGAKESNEVVSTTGNVLTLLNIPGFTIEANVDFVKPDNQALATLLESPSGFDGFDYTYQILDDENDPAVPFVSRYR